MTDSKEFTLYGYFRSSASWRVRLALEWKGIAYEQHSVNLAQGDQKKDEFLAINPSKKVPALVTKEHKVLTQSIAILEYIEEHYPDRPMLPKSLWHRAQVREIVQAIACDIHPLQNLGVLIKQGGGDLEKREAWAREWITQGFEGLERHLEEVSGTYCVGDNITMADFCLVPMVYNAFRYKVDMKQFPVITRINNTLLTLPEFKKTHPHNQEDCPPELRGHGV
ncbi:glutathione S-transferase zeta 1 [Radiomyces spectabilis]|uniref:glutathione S-transferase zeta 1 n=1 Tax=Radiomyces spectabilis TaxID=64574 RepID=UPI00221FF970|nr:glutathione S-transferase zeta 1 [Radiomyces spectabilis]KAI8391015.1 glutathione S-transferase zeta 1 [Radiomyces spectabilis]